MARQITVLTSERWCGDSRLRYALPPSVKPDAPGFQPRSYWRGPQWPFLNWLLWWALTRRRESQIAAMIRHESLRQVGDLTFAEYYQPFTGEPLGSTHQSWTAAVTLDWLAESQLPFHGRPGPRPARAAYVTAPFSIRLCDVNVPAPGPGDVLIEVIACGICGSDLNEVASRAKEPRTLGHEVVGTVIEVGPGVMPVRLGDQVCLASSWPCGICRHCQNGRVQFCLQLQGMQTYSPAQGFGSIMLVPERAVVSASSLEPDVAALAEPLSVALDIVRTCGIGSEDSLLIVGPGPIGLLALAAARQAGARDIVMAARTAPSARTRLATAWGAHVTSIDRLTEAQERQPFDRIIVTAHPAVLGSVVPLAAPGAVIAYNGIAPQEGVSFSIDADQFHCKRLQLRASHAAPSLFLPDAVRLLSSNVVAWADVVTHRFALDDLERALSLVAGDRSNVIKVLIYPRSAGWPISSTRPDNS